MAQLAPTGRSGPSRIAFSTLAFPAASLAAAASAGRRWGYSGIELRLIDGELIDPATSAARRAEVRRILAAAGLPVVAVDSSIRLTGDGPGPALRRFLQLASEWEAPLVRVFGGPLDPPPARRDRLRAAAAGGYPHWISVEWEKRWHPGIEAPEVALPQHLAQLATWLESGP